MLVKLFPLALFVAVTVSLPAEPKEANDSGVSKMFKSMQMEIHNLEIHNLALELHNLEIHNLKVENQKLTAQYAALEKQVKVLQDKTLSPALTGNVGSLFLATISREMLEIGDEEVIVFDTTSFNQGGHYNTKTGEYTAPYNGYYQFSVTKSSNAERSQFRLSVDGQIYAHHILYTQGWDPTGSMTINMELTAGQVVSVINDSSPAIYGTGSDGAYSTWFTGYLLYLL